MCRGCPRLCRLHASGVFLVLISFDRFWNSVYKAGPKGFRMNQSILTINGLDISLGTAAAAFSASVLAVLVIIAAISVRAFRQREQETARQMRQSEAMETRMAELARVQAETVGRLQALGEGLGGRQAELARVMAERFDEDSMRLGHSMYEVTHQTIQRVQSLHERIAVIDHAQKSFADLSGQVTSLRDVLGNKQARGAFGQARMETIVADGLPKGLFAFQYTLSNNTRPDCVIFLPDQRPLVIDAKFPLESITAFRQAKTDEDRLRAAQRLRQDVWKHISDIASKYLLPGETQEMALMFVPSESLYAELYDGFDDLVQKAYRARVVMVSPSLLRLASDGLARADASRNVPFRSRSGRETDLGGNARRLLAPAGARRFVPRVLGRAAAGVIRVDAAAVDG